MKKNKHIQSFCVLCVFALIILSCNKEKRFSKKLIKGEEWQVEHIYIDGNQQSLPNISWEVIGDDIYKEVPLIRWGSKFSEHTYFEWQFQDKGKAWYLNFLLDSSKCDGPDLTDLDYLAHALSGKYKVEKHKKKEMIFKSNSLPQLMNKEVEIRIVKQN
jgi:hypothetical protein